jgi:ubiquinone/menaquinone biosynthesis C-methylase UbiE
MSMQSEFNVRDESAIHHLSTREGYDRWSSIYDSDGNPLIALEEPLVDRLLGNVMGLNIIDLGCGTGRHALRVAKAGAHVQAVDFSEQMLARARQKAQGTNVLFHSHDLSERLPFPESSFDRVVCGLVLDHIVELDSFFRNMQHVCKPNGFAVVSVMHPAMMLRGVQARFWDPQTGRQVRPASERHQISDYVMAAVRAGFHIDHLSEHAVDQTLADQLPRGQRYVGWPILFLMRLSPAC